MKTLIFSFLFFSFSAFGGFTSFSRPSFRPTSTFRPIVRTYSPAPRVYSPPRVYSSPKVLSVSRSSNGAFRTATPKTYSSNSSFTSMMPYWALLSMNSRPIPRECKCKDGKPVNCPKEVSCK